MGWGCSCRIDLGIPSATWNINLPESSENYPVHRIVSLDSQRGLAKHLLLGGHPGCERGRQLSHCSFTSSLNARYANDERCGSLHTHNILEKKALGDGGF